MELVSLNGLDPMGRVPIGYQHGSFAIVNPYTTWYKLLDPFVQSDDPHDR